MLHVKQMTVETGETEPAKRCFGNPATRFKPGVSGNPNGRPKKAQQIVEKAQDNAEKALKALIDLMGSDDERVKLAAAMAILDRGLGKPKQTIDDGRKQEIGDYSTDELRAIAGISSARTIEATASPTEPDRFQ